MGFSIRKSGQGIRILLCLFFVLSLWGCNTGSESGSDTPKTGATAIAKAAADKPVINETLSSSVQNRYIKGIAGSRMIYTDAGGQDTYTILPAFCGDVEIIDNDVSTVNFPAGLNISSSQFMSDKVLFTINGFILTFSGRPSLFNFVFAGTPLSNATGVLKTFEQTAQVFGTTVPLPGQPFNESTITGIIQGNGTPKPTSNVPTISSLTASPTGRAVNNAVINLTATASDIDGDVLTYSWTASSGTIIGTGATAKWTAPASGSGTATISLIVKDQANAQAIKTVSITYGVNSAPVISGLTFIPSAGSSAINYGASLKVDATDADGDALTYIWTASAGTITGTGSTVTWSPPASGRGAAIIEVIVKDTSNTQDTISNSINYGTQTPPVISSLTASPSGTAVNNAVINLTATASDPDGDALKYFSWNASVGTIIKTGVNTAIWTAPASGSGTATISATVYDIYDVQNTKSISISYKSNSTPTISNITASPSGRAANNAVINLAATASDIDGDVLTYSWTASSGTIIGTGATAKWTAPASGSGTATISLIVKDQANAQAIKTVSITYGVNSAPVISGLTFIPSAGSSAINYGASLKVDATDADGDALTYIWTASAGTITGTGSTVTWSPPASGRGAALIEVIVKDTSNSQDTASNSINYGTQTAPVISSLTASPSGTAVNNAVINLTTTASDPDGDALKYFSWNASVGTIIKTGVNTAIWTAPASGSGTATISATVYDIYDVQNTKSVSIAYSSSIKYQPLNDTGITTFGYSIGNYYLYPYIDFPGQDADYGRDKINNDDSDGRGGFSFTKIGSNGETLPVIAAYWFAVKDNITGLMWEVKTTDGGLHDKKWKYTWYEPDSTKNGGNSGVLNGGECGGTIVSADTYHFVQAVNAENFCGHNDWRMPTISEFISIIDFGNNSYSAIITFFPDIISGYWTSSPTAYFSFFSDLSDQGAWISGGGRGSKDCQEPVMLVRNAD